MIEVRRAEPDEIGLCAALYERVAREIFTWIDRGAIKAQDIVDDAREEEVYVAVEDGRLLGFASFFQPSNFLHSLYIDAEARGRGAGSALFDHVTARAKGPISLKVQKRNLTAIAFYRRKGMEITENGVPDVPGGGWWRMGF